MLLRLAQVTMRFIPGYAGNAFRVTGVPDSRAVYPRLRGERIQSCDEIKQLVGLSPATRGTHILRCATAMKWRFIPGYAGNASSAVFFRFVSSVYPRLRGERCHCNEMACRPGGLSPATRGTRRYLFQQFCFSSVYPRLRGERMKLTRTPMNPAGLSPATRGTQSLYLQQVGRVRFIPGYAGNAL